MSWLHVLKLCMRPLQLLAQSLDVFIVLLVLLLVHLRQRPQAFDAMLCLHHTLSVFKGRRSSAGLMIPLKAWDEGPVWESVGNTVKPPIRRRS
jgi:hypothetical protein